MDEHSKNFDKVRGYYDKGLWTEGMVRDAAQNPTGRPWITESEVEEIITGRPPGGGSDE